MQYDTLCCEAISIADWVSIIIASLAIIVSVFSYFHGLNRERRTDTLKAFSEISTSNYFTNEMSEAEKLEYLNSLEYFSTGVNSRIYSFGIVYKPSANRLIHQYENWTKDYIEKYTQIEGNSEAYCEYKSVITRLIRRRDVKNRVSSILYSTKNE